MNIEIFGLVGLVLITSAFAVRTYERRMDVLYGPYIQYRAGARARRSVKRFWKPASSAIDRLLALESWRMTYLPSIEPC
jgi:hypothetical protein